MYPRLANNKEEHVWLHCTTRGRAVLYTGLLRRRTITFVVWITLVIMGKNNQTKLFSNQVGNWHRSLKTHKFMLSTLENNARRPFQVKATTAGATQVRCVQQQSTVFCSAFRTTARTLGEISSCTLPNLSDVFRSQIQPLWTANHMTSTSELRITLRPFVLGFFSLALPGKSECLGAHLYVGLRQAADFFEAPKQIKPLLKTFKTRAVSICLACLIFIRYIESVHII